MQLTEEFEECYTLRHNPLDYTGTVASITTNGTIYDSWAKPESAINGYFCFHHGSCFLAVPLENTNLRVDLGVSRNISSIEFIVASYDMWPTINTQNIRVRLGDNPNYDNNPEFTYLPGIAPRNVVITLLPNILPFMSGRYLQLIAEADNSFFGICDLRILG